jgi:hypothetical protein
MVIGADHGRENSGTQTQLSGNGVTGGIIANTGGGSPGANVRAQYGYRDIERRTNIEDGSTGVEWEEAWYEPMVRQPPGANGTCVAKNRRCRTPKEQQLYNQQHAGRWRN